MSMKSLVGAGHKIMGSTLPVALLVIVLNVVYPRVFTLHLGPAGIALGCIFLLVGVPVWLTSVVQILISVPKNKLITRGPFAIVLHPLYTSVALLVIPGVGFLLDTWAGLGIGGSLYVFSRIFSNEENRRLYELFPGEYQAYRSSVLLPWL